MFITFMTVIAWHLQFSRCVCMCVWKVLRRYFRAGSWKAIANDTLNGTDDRNTFGKNGQFCYVSYGNSTQQIAIIVYCIQYHRRNS